MNHGNQIIHTLFTAPLVFLGPTGEMAVGQRSAPRQRSDVPEMSRKDLRKSERQIWVPEDV